MLSNKLIIIFFFKVLIFNSILKAQPLVILEYSDNKVVENNSYESEDFSTYYQTKKNDTLSKIIEKFYGNKGLNYTFLQAAILYKNKKAFVRSNPNFMYANKKLYLPSINEIKDLVYRDKKKLTNMKKTNINQEIYFFRN